MKNLKAFCYDLFILVCVCSCIGINYKYLFIEIANMDATVDKLGIFYDKIEV